MPIKSVRQFGAMAAAAHNQGTSDIPPAVAREMIAKTPKATRIRFARKQAKKRQLTRKS